MTAPADLPAPAGSPAPGARRERALAMVACLVGSAVVLFSASATWVSAQVQAGTGGQASAVAAPLPVKWSGESLAPAATALALLGLAATLAIIATRRVGRTLVGVLLAGAGVAIFLIVGGIALDPMAAVRGTDEVRALVPIGDPTILDLSRTVAPWLASFGGLVLAITGAVVVARAGTWPAMSGRYQARAAAPADAWDAIERGQDPT
ncbi:Trp biosynthesis-associated membrane protein [Frankia sp. Mgl5]|uniref:Trp biosynthesis-associated membrane protein n=1 Tax=Frankia sp. Mgl5 TaxID=2933793 RepID=UPI00200F4E7E|nr:Trp biosynthesis-associated membrane protein [Frankia sp. Mgl5]MCK9932216.1 Trp biosynthesis-associated membrane protein [Frankia sp. Mgl5]